MSPPLALEMKEDENSAEQRSASEQSMPRFPNSALGPDTGFTASNVPSLRRFTGFPSANYGPLVADSNGINTSQVHSDGRDAASFHGQPFQLPSHTDIRGIEQRNPDTPQAQNQAGHVRRSSLDMELLEELNQGSQDSASNSSSSSRNSPEADVPVCAPPVHDLNFGFLRLAMGSFRLDASPLNAVNTSTKLFAAGDRSFPNETPRGPMVNFSYATSLVKTYFQLAMVSWRFLHQGRIEAWTQAACTDEEWYSMYPTKKSILEAVWALANHHTNGPGITSDLFFLDSVASLERESGPPRLESVQARLAQCFYLLATSRITQAWYTFGSAAQLVAMLGLERKQRHHDTDDYIEVECRKRTFWVVYTLEKYFSFIMSSSRGFSDEAIDQDLPEAVNDEYMTPEGSSAQRKYNSTTSALIGHAKFVLPLLTSFRERALTRTRLSQLLSQMTKHIYPSTPPPPHVRLAATRHFATALTDWKASLPAIFGNDEIRASDLAPVLGRQSRSLTLAYAHAMILATRPCLVGPLASDPIAIDATRKCIAAAQTIVETTLAIADEEPHFQLPWWTAYVTFTALVVTNVYAIRRLASSGARHIEDAEPESDVLSRDLKLFSMAEKLQERFVNGLGEGLVGVRYRIVLDALRGEYRRLKTVRETGRDDALMADAVDGQGVATNAAAQAAVEAEPVAWEATEWAELDAWTHKYRAVG